MPHFSYSAPVGKRTKILKLMQTPLFTGSVLAARVKQIQTADARLLYCRRCDCGIFRERTDEDFEETYQFLDGLDFAGIACFFSYSIRPKHHCRGDEKRKFSEPVKKNPQQNGLLELSLSKRTVGFLSKPCREDTANTGGKRPTSRNHERIHLKLHQMHFAIQSKICPIISSKETIKMIDSENRIGNSKK